jgi:uncharacterized protein YjbI with pentapeptide repeats
MPANNGQAWFRKNATNLLRIAIVVLFLLLAAWAISLNHLNRVIASHEPWLWLTTALVSVGPELAGIVIGVVTIDYLNERRQTEQLKAQLIRQMGSDIRDVAIPAARELAHHGWLYDGSLSGAYLTVANLSRAFLINANLSRAYLGVANLSEAILVQAKLSMAKLKGTNLSRARMDKADLGGAILEGTNLSGARMDKADLGGAILWYANLSGADLEGANLSNAMVALTNLSRANLELANLSGVILMESDLSEANLAKVDLNGAYLAKTNVRGAIRWTIEQLEQAETLEASIMPDGVQLGENEKATERPTFAALRLGQEEAEDQNRIKGPTFDEWKAQYLAQYGGAVTDIRDSPE